MTQFLLLLSWFSPHNLKAMGQNESEHVYHRCRGAFTDRLTFPWEAGMKLSSGYRINVTVGQGESGLPRCQISWSDHSRVVYVVCVLHSQLEGSCSNHSSAILHQSCIMVHLVVMQLCEGEFSKFLHRQMVDSRTHQSQRVVFLAAQKQSFQRLGILIQVVKKYNH